MERQLQLLEQTGDVEKILDAVLKRVPSIENRDGPTMQQLAEWVGRDLRKYQERDSNFQDSSVREVMSIAVQRGLPMNGLRFGWEKALRGV